MEDLTLENCENCTSLPSLGLMGSLKRLIIKGMKKIVSVGSEFCGKNCSKPFQSLETLCFKDLQEWKSWDINSEENGLVAGFSNLRKLSIVECPKLSGNLPEQLPSLEKLFVDKCSELIVSFSCYRLLRKLRIGDCKGLVCSTLIDSNLTESMIISNSSLQVYGCKGMMYDDCTAAKSRSVTITNILELGKFLNQGFQQVETLWIGDFQQIKSWWDDMGRFKKREQGMHVFTFPGEVSIEEGCVSLVPFPEIKFFPTNLRSLKIGQCRALKSLPEEIMGSNSKLESLYIRECDSLTSIGRRKLPSSLKSLKIENCEKLEALPLKDGFPTNLTSLTIDNNMKVYKALIEWGLHRLTSLTSLDIRGCDDAEMEMMLPASLTYLALESWSKLRCLSSTCFQSLTSLKFLRIVECPNLTSFPEEGLPSSLLELEVRECSNLKNECKRDKGKEWSKIAHIPYIFIDDIFVLIDGKFIDEE